MQHSFLEEATRNQWRLSEQGSRGAREDSLVPFWNLCFVLFFTMRVNCLNNDDDDGGSSLWRAYYMPGAVPKALYTLNK